MLALLFTLLTVAIPAQEKADDIDAVVHRATAYVEQYEAELGNLIASEDYVQNALWMNGAVRGLGSGSNSTRKQRRTSSDFLMIQVGPDWIGLRKVNLLDGMKVKDPGPSLDAAFDDTPAANRKRLKSMSEESAHYNIGDVVRTINTPTFALKVLRTENASRFTFEKTGSEKIDGVQTWAVRFREVKGPSLVMEGEGGVDIDSNGMFWIEPASGKVLRTEFVVPNPHSKYPLTATVIVTYVENKKLGMLVPKLMTERYDAGTHTIDCRADYTNFRRFEVDVKSDIAPPKP